MKNALFSFVLLCLSTPLFAAGRVGPYIYQYSGDPTAVSTSIINPEPGAIIIDGSNGQRAIKLSPRGDNSTFAVQTFILSGTISISGTGNGQVQTVASLPGNFGSWLFTSAQVLCTTGTNASAAQVVQILSGTTTLTGTGTTLSGTSSNTYTAISPQAAAPLVVSGTGTTALNFKLVNVGTSSGSLGKVFIHGFKLP